MNRWRIHSLVSLRGILAVAALFFAASSLPAQDEGTVGDSDPALDAEIYYIKGLRDLRLSDYADRVLAKTKEKWPSAGPRLKQVELEGLLYGGKFDEVKAIIAKEPNKDGLDAWAMRLALADAYFLYARFDDACDIYQQFFKKYEKSTPDTAAFWLPSAYRFAQMYIHMKQDASALDAYRRVLANTKDTSTQRRCKGEMCEIAVRVLDGDGMKDAKARDALIKEATKWADDLLWDQDQWFGKGIVLKAHLLMIQGKPEAAKKLVDTYMPQLKSIHEGLVEQAKEFPEVSLRESPMPQCRFLLATMLQDAANKLLEQETLSDEDRETVLANLIGDRKPNGQKGRVGNGAFQHFVNVFIQYPESAWAAEAGERSEQIRAVISKRFGTELKTSVTAEQMAKVLKLQFQEANLLYTQGQLEQAIESYLRVLNQAADSLESIQALGNLARAYYESATPENLHMLYGDMVVHHIADRFGSNPVFRDEAGNTVVRIAEFCGEQGWNDRRRDLYDVFFRDCPEHAMVPTYLKSFAMRHYSDEDYPTALDYLGRLACYTNSPLGEEALRFQADIYGKTSQFTNEIAVLDTYIARLEGRPKPGQDFVSASFRRAQARKSVAVAMLHDTTNEIDIATANASLNLAVREFHALADAIAKKGDLYQENEEEAGQNRQIREYCLFNKAYCLARLTRPEGKADAFKQAAVKAYEDLVATFPESALAPTALLQANILCTSLKKTEEAEKLLSRLRKDYPDSEESKNAIPLQARNLMELGQRNEAVALYAQMFKESGKYSNSDLLQAGNILLESGAYDVAAQAFERVLASGETAPAVVAAARLGSARILLHDGRYDECMDSLKAFLSEYGKTSLMVDASLLLSEASAEAGMRERDAKKRLELFNQAVKAAKDVKPYRTTPLEQATDDLSTGRLLTKRAKAEESFGDPNAAKETRGQAIVSYLMTIMNVPASNVALAPVLEQAYHECIDLMVQNEVWEDAADKCREYLSDFPRGKYVADIQGRLNECNVHMGNTAAE